MEENITKMEWKQLDKLFTDYNSIIDKIGGQGFKGYVVYSEKNYEEGYWEAEFSDIKSRTYEFSSDSKAFHSWMGGYSIFADSLDGSDRCVRIEKLGWIIEYCYMDKDDYKKIIGVIENNRDKI